MCDWLCDLKHKVALSATLCFKKSVAGAIGDIYSRSCGGKRAVFLLRRIKFLSRAFYGRAESPPVFEHGVWKEGRHPFNRRTLALDLKFLRQVTDFFT